MKTQDEERALRDQHKEAFETALLAAVSATPDLVADSECSRVTIWVSFGGNGNDGFWVSSHLRNAHLPEMFIGSSVNVDHLYPGTDEEGEEETLSCRVLAEDVAPNKTRDYDHLATLAINAIRAHVHEDEDEDE